jgi:hypothetical protein
MELSALYNGRLRLEPARDATPHPARGRLQTQPGIHTEFAFRA